MSIEIDARRILFHKLKMRQAMGMLEVSFKDNEGNRVDLEKLDSISDEFCIGIDLPRTEDGFDSKTINRFIAEVCRVHNLKDPRCDCDRETTGPVPSYCRIHDGDYSSWLAINNID